MIARLSPAIALILVSIPSAAGAQPNTSVVAAGGKVRTIKLADERGAPTGKLSLIVRIRCQGVLDVAFVPSDGGPRVAPTRVAPRGDVAALRLVARVPKTRLARGDIVGIRVKFVLPENATLSGALTLATCGGNPLVIAVEGAAPAATPRWTFEQDKVTVTVTRETPGPFGDDETQTRTIGLRDAQPKETVTTAPLASTLVALDGSGEANAALNSPATGTDDVKSAKLTISGEGQGSGTAKLRLGDSERQELEVTIRMRDALWWPLIVILMGVLLGGPLSARRSIRRQARLIRRELAAAHHQYKIARKKGNRSGARRIEDPEGVEDDPRWVRGVRNWARPRWWPKKAPWFEAPPNTGIAGLYSRLGRVSTAEALEVEADAAEDTINTMSNWRSIDAALKDLDQAIAEARKVFKRSRPRPLLDAEELFDQTFEIPSDLAAGTVEATRITAQAEALSLYALAKPLYDNLVAGEDGLAGQDDRRRVRRSNPDPIYLRHSAARSRIPETATRLVTELHDAYDELRHVAERNQSSFQLFAASPAVPAALEWFARIVAPKGAPSSDEVLASVRRGDWLQYIAALLISSLVYLLPLYVDKSWGSWTDYLAAFAAGFAGSVVVSEALTPLSRSLKAFPTKQAAAKA